MKPLFISLFSILITLTILSGHARVLTTTESINKAGQQRMLSQRISKNYLAVANRIFTSDSTAELKSSIELFEENITNLSESVFNPTSKLALTELKEN